ncbi:PAN3 [Candida theae]|uniref:PAN2-PAN3 deadenylation complex subunit PAN3 n=1 Tax=Candida theae TaxID=1198502 RepID=A0AAD5BBA6_9ASCO|nr:PAN3 [Candida theae]KAI5950369.1 PAN3 [Candida theae]
MNINLDSAKDVLCKNVLIYGYCKYQDKGCAFSHHKSTGLQPSGNGNGPSQDQGPGSGSHASQLQTQPSHQLRTKSSRSRLSQSQQSLLPSTAPANLSNSNSGRKKFNIETPLFQPSGTKDKMVNGITSKFSNLSPTVKDAPVFQPESFQDQEGKQAPQQQQQQQPQQQQQQSNSSGLPFGSRKFNASTPSFTPSSFEFTPGAASPGTAPLSQQSQTQKQQQQVQQQHQYSAKSQVLASPNGPSSARSSGGIIQPQHTSANPYSQDTQSPIVPANQSHVLHSSVMNSAPLMSSNFFPSQQNQLHQQGQGLGGPPPPHPPPPPPPPPTSQSQSHQQGPLYPLQYHLYAPAPPPRLTVPIKDNETNALKMFIPNEVRESLHRKNEASLQTLQHSNLPEHVNSYHSLVPIDASYEAVSRLWPGKSSLLFKCYSNIDGNLYALRKIEPCNEVTDDSAFKSIKTWQLLNTNANIVGIKDVFTSLAFSSIGGSKADNSTALCFVYDYYPNSKTLLEYHKKALRVEPITEDLLWVYLVQLVNALKSIHSKELYVGCSMEVSKIINTGENRIRLSSCGISDVLDYGKVDKPDVKELQRRDVKNLGKVMLDLSSLLLPINLRSSQEDILVRNLANSTNISGDFIEVLKVLNGDAQEFNLKQFVCDYLVDKTFATINSLQNSTDYFESQLTSELENARLFRLLTKINFVVSTTTGDNNLNTQSLNDINQIKVIELFQQTLFQTYDSNGARVVNLHKVLVSLNKLDCGVDEKLLLVKENEYIIVSYKEIKEIIDSQFRQLKN